MAEIGISRVDHVVDNIARIQKLLHQDIERVNKLEALLVTEKQQMEQRKQELTDYQTAVMATAVPRTSINDCPPEILSLILKLFVSENVWMRHAGHLLRVCKRWHGLIINDPNLWNLISIFPPFVLGTMRRTPLNIELDFAILKTAKHRLCERFHSGFSHFPFFSQADGDYELLEDWLDNLDYYDLECETIFHWEV